MYNFKKEKGITLVSLIITVIILLILSSVVMYNVTNDDGLMSAVKDEKNLINETDAKQTVEIAIEKLKIESDDNIEQFIEKLKTELQKEDTKAKVTINSKDENMYDVTFKGYKYSYYYYTDQTRTITGRMPAYYNPIIPKGFDILETEDASWEVVEDENLGKIVKGWNDGLVIQDRYGNEFVWVPVDGTDVKYEKKIYSNNEARVTNLSVLSESVLPNNIDEEEQIKKYGGFYIARYEAGINENTTDSKMKNALKTASMDARNIEGIPVSKKNQVPWNFIDYGNAKKNSENMYKTQYVQSVLVTGNMWDTILKWLENDGVNVETGSNEWGNFINSTIPGITEYSTDDGATWQKVNQTIKGTSDIWLLKTGHTDYTKRKNIYDISGNLWEWTNEVYNTSNYIDRGGCNFQLSTDFFPGCRWHSGGEYYTGGLTFRVALYVK